MKDYQKALIELRSKLNISQEELAKVLKVSFSSVNRWENGHFEPTKIVKFRLDKLLEENGIEVEEDESR
ncbi:MAG: helix-turn-helix domain-containing protein [Bacilli bacterium]